MKHKKTLGAALLIPCLIVLFGFGQTVFGRYTLAVSGTIIQSHDVPGAQVPRYATEYVLVNAAGVEHAYIAGANDASLPRSMPVGTVIKKEQGTFAYERDGVAVDDFALLFYIIGISLGVAGLLGSLALLLL